MLAFLIITIVDLFTQANKKSVCNKPISVRTHFTCATQVVEMPLDLFLPLHIFFFISSTRFSPHHHYQPKPSIFFFTCTSSDFIIQKIFLLKVHHHHSTNTSNLPDLFSLALTYRSLHLYLIFFFVVVAAEYFFYFSFSLSFV